MTLPSTFARSRRIVFISVTALLAPILASRANAQTPVRIATWNVLSVGTPDSVGYQAELAILRRIGADIVGVNEVSSAADTLNFAQLASDAGYPNAFAPATNPFGATRNGIMSKYPFVASAIHTSPALSGDPSANDISRLILEITVDLPGNAQDLTVLSDHLKSGGTDTDEFRRACEAIRISQALAGRNSLRDAYVVMGDINESTAWVPQWPDPIVDIPADLPVAFSLGADLQAILTGPGFKNNPFHHWQQTPGPLMSVVEARQLDGDWATFPASGIQIDYILVSRRLHATGSRAEVYDSNDEGLPGGLTKYGAALPSSTSNTASDHFLLFADIVVPAAAECGDGLCEGAENGCNCDADCGPAIEHEGTANTCHDGLDNDCDGAADCDDPDCATDPTCPSCGNGYCEAGENCRSCPGDCLSEDGPWCGNWICEPSAGEDCVSCPEDCRGRYGGATSGRFCCGDGDGLFPVGCDDPRCNADGWVCTDVAAEASCCGDGRCEGSENPANCAIDCVAGLFDLNCDGSVNVADAAPLVLALLDPASYTASYPGCDITRSDGNSDGDTDGSDIEAFLTMLQAP